MKKIEHYYVLIENKKQAEQYKYILAAAGIDTSNFVVDDYDINCREIGFCKRGGFWLSGGYSEDGNYQNVSIGQLIDLLNETQKIAVKVENEKEFKAIEKHLGKQSFFQPPFQSVSYPAFIYLDGGKYPNKDFVSIDCGEIYLKDYKIIPFAEFAEEHNIKLPLLKSADGIDLYEDDPYVMVKNIPATNNEWKITREDVKLKETHFPITDLTNCLAFSTKQAALDWIEAHKPKLPESVLMHQDHQLKSEVFSDHLEIYGDFVALINTDMVINMSKKELEEILFAMNNSVIQK